MEDARLHHELYKFAEKVQPIYKLLDWTWSGGGVPDTKGIHDTLFSLYTDLLKLKKKTRISSGGLFFELQEDGTYEFGMEIQGPFFTEEGKFYG